jgi:dolichol kinase
MLEFKRKMFHIASGLLIVLLLRMGMPAYMLFITLCVGLPVSLYSKRKRLPLVGWFLDNFDRPGTDPPGKGALTFLIGILLVYVLFSGYDTNVVYASILVLALGDSVSCLVGRGLKDRNYSRLKHPLSAAKVLEGTIAGLIAGFLGALYFLPWQEALAASFLGMVVEGLELRFGERVLDDNLLVPLAAATTVFLFRHISSLI